jgi:hypothetical protein
MKFMYDMFHIPYYNALIVKNGDVVGKAIVKVSKTRAKYFRVKKFRAAFILPDMRMKDKDDKRIKIEPVRIKSGLLLIYDIKNAFPMKLVSHNSLIDEVFEEEQTEPAIYPSGYIPAPVDSEELHDFLEAKVTEDILSDNQKEIPMWLIYLVTIVIAGAVILGALYMVTKDGGQTIINTAPGVTPTPTPGYVITP